MARRVWEGTQALRRTHGQVRWTEPSRYHVTLRFLGGVDPDRAEELPALLDRASRVPVFSATVQDIGVFGGRRRPPIFWAGVDSPELVSLKTRLDRELEAWGLGPESRPFRGHITLGRGKGPLKGPRADEARALDGGTFAVDRLLLVESALEPAGARYTTRYASALSGADTGTLEPRGEDD